MFFKRFLAVTLLATSFSSLFAWQPKSLFDVVIEPTQLIIQPLNEYQSYRVSLLGPICRDTLTFKGGETAVIDLFDPKTGEPFEDGPWSYRLDATPVYDGATWEEINYARKVGDYKTLAVLTPQKGEMIQSGAFHMLEGRSVNPYENEKSAGKTDKRGPVTTNRVADHVIIDDLIVDGSACIGFDCVNGESFGFDTLRLKENNLRIKFDDTSTAASFPRNDWQLTANDSANGGQSKFSIDDISGGRTPFTVEANAPSHSLYVDDGGRIGLGTSTPSTEIHAIDGDTPALRLQQDGSSGFAPQTWDVAGNETNFFIRDVSNGSALPVRIRPGADSNSLFIDQDNDIGFGTASPDAALDLERDDDALLLLQNTTATSAAREMFRTKSAGDIYWYAENTVDSEYWRIMWEGDIGMTIQYNGGRRDLWIDEHHRFRTAPTASGYVLLADPNANQVTVTGNLSVTGDINATGSINAMVPSDVNLKEDFEVVNPMDVLEKVAAMPMSTWKYKDRDGRHMGVMAQDFYNAFGLGVSDKGIFIGDGDGVAIAAIQGLNHKVDARDAEIVQLKEHNQKLEERLKALEAMINKLTNDQ